jgi:hypothetical protein
LRESCLHSRQFLTMRNTQDSKVIIRRITIEEMSKILDFIVIVGGINQYRETRQEGRNVHDSSVREVIERDIQVL